MMSAHNSNTFTVKCPPYPPVTLNIPIQWDIDPNGTKFWRHNFMTFRWVDENIPPSIFKILLKDFIDYHITNKRPNPYYDSVIADHPTVIRIEWLLAYKSRIGKGADEEISRLIDEVIKCDIQNINKQSNYRAGHNHGLMVDIVLLRCYACEEKFRDVIPLADIIKRAFDTLYCMFSQESGVTKEHSIEYQQYNFRIFKDLYDLLTQNEVLNSNIDIAPVSAFYEKVRQSAQELIAMSLREPGHILFPAGDTMLSASAHGLEEIFGCSAPLALRQAAALRGQKRLALFKEGFCFFRGDGQESKLDLAFLCGWHSANHKQNDELSFILDYSGVNFFDDAGYSAYLVWDEILKLQDEDHHSTITVEDMAWSDRNKPDGRNVIGGSLKDGYCYISGEHYRINGSRVSRNIHLSGNSVFITDCLDLSLRKMSRHRFVLGRDVKILNIDHDHSKISFIKDNVAMQMHCLCDSCHISTEMISVVSVDEKELEARMALDFFVEPATESPSERRACFFITFDGTGPQAFLSGIEPYGHEFLKQARSAAITAQSAPDRELDMASPRKMIVTVDVEALPGRAEADHVDRLIWGRPEGGGFEYGIGRMMDIADKHGVRISFFLEYARRTALGDGLLDAGREILRRGHDLQLHMHGEQFDSDFFTPRGLPGQRDMRLWTREHWQFALDYILNAHAAVTSAPAAAYRSGAFTFNMSLLEVLAERGIPLASNYLPCYTDRFPFLLGMQKHFRWPSGVFELPVSCVENFPGSTYTFCLPEHIRQAPGFTPSRCMPYDFNGPLLEGSMPDCAAGHRRYLDSFYQACGSDAVAVMLMHSWSFFDRNERGLQNLPNEDSVYKFDAALAELAKDTLFTTMGEFASNLPATQAFSSLTQSGMPVAGENGQSVSLQSSYMQPEAAQAVEEKTQAVCPICQASVSRFLDFNGGSKRQCPECLSLERQRVFQHLYASGAFGEDNLKGKRILHVGPSASETRLLSAIPGTEIVTLEIRPGFKTDLTADLASMTEIPDSSFDAVFLSYVLCMVSPQKFPLALAELARVLKSGGLMFSYDDVRDAQKTIHKSDIEKIIHTYGMDNYHKYGIGDHVTFAAVDYENIFHEYFDTKLYLMEDLPTNCKCYWLKAVRKEKNEGPLPPEAHKERTAERDATPAIAPLAPPNTAFPNKAQKCIITCLKPFIRLFAPLEYIIQFERDPSDFFYGTKYFGHRPLMALLSCFGPRPEKTSFNLTTVRKFLNKRKN